ncbi:MAG: deoxyribodipyrimidine photo-lyase, partial [Crocinitomicaceae bacterium]
MFNVVWLKKDLRLHDHVALTTAIENNFPTVVLFILENEWLKQDDFSNRHWRFAYECLIDIGKRLNKTTKILYVLQGDVLAIFNELKLTHGDFNLFSHEETGNNFTYKRDKNIKSFCKKNNIVWREWPQFSVQRGLKNRINWTDEWSKFMSVSQKEVNLNSIIPFQLDLQFNEKYKLTHHPKKEIDLQLGGENEALNLWANFLAFRH